VARWIPLNPCSAEVGAAALLRLDERFNGLGSGEAAVPRVSGLVFCPASLSKVCKIRRAVSVVTAAVAGSFATGEGPAGVALGPIMNPGVSPCAWNAGGGMEVGGPESRGMVERPRSRSCASNSAASLLRLEPANIMD